MIFQNQTNHRYISVQGFLILVVWHSPVLLKHFLHIINVFLYRDLFILSVCSRLKNSRYYLNVVVRCGQSSLSARVISSMHRSTMKPCTKFIPQYVVILWPRCHSPNFNLLLLTNNLTHQPNAVKNIQKILEFILFSKITCCHLVTRNTPYFIRNAS